MAAHQQAIDQAVADVAAGRPSPANLPPDARPAPEAQVLIALDPEARAARIAANVLRAIDTETTVPGAAWRDDLGAITVDWGQAGDPKRQFRGGFGLAHIIARRNAEGINGREWAALILPDILARGEASPAYGAAEGRVRVNLDWQGQRVVLRLDRDGTRENWVLTGFPLRNGGPGGTEGLSPRPPYAPGPTFHTGQTGAGPPPSSVAPGARRFQAFTPAGRAVLVEPQVVELRTLVPSHLDDGALNPAYPHAEGVQPRDRGAAPSQDQVRAIAAGLIPERLAPSVEAGFGAPIVADDLVVESGNGRVAALRRVYGDNSLSQVAEAYRDFPARQGFDVAGIEQPVLVSRRVSAPSPEERRAFVAEANGRATLAQGVAERARADAAMLDDALPLWRGGDVDSLDNAPFVRA